MAKSKPKNKYLWLEKRAAIDSENQKTEELLSQVQSKNVNEKAPSNMVDKENLESNKLRKAYNGKFYDNLLNDIKKVKDNEILQYNFKTPIQPNIDQRFLNIFCLKYNAFINKINFVKQKESESSINTDIPKEQIDTNTDFKKNLFRNTGFYDKSLKFSQS